MKKVFTILVAIMSIAFSSCHTQSSIVIPAPIKPGSRIAIVTPASASADAPILTTIERLRGMGYEPVVMPHVFGSAYGNHPASPEERAADLMAAFTDPAIDAILCSRGGYGCNQLLEILDTDAIRANPKWLVGYSDISILLAMLQKLGIAGIHGPMTGHMAKVPDDDPATAYVFDILTGKLPITYTVAPYRDNIPGTVKGTLVGGNFIVLNNLAQTPYDVLNVGPDDNVILFLEDVGENIYAIERMLVRLHQSGALANIKGLIVGRYSDYEPEKDFQSIEDMFSFWLKKWGYTFPVAFDFPCGHLDENNYPLIVGSQATLSVTPEAVTLTME